MSFHTKDNQSDLLAEIARYYSGKLAEFGETPLGVDWRDGKGQRVRFEQLCKVINKPHYFSLNDLGCGYGAMFEYLTDFFEDFIYFGIDIAEDMIASAEARYENESKAAFVVSSKPNQLADFSLASGIFNVRQQRCDDEWMAYIVSTLDVLNQFSRFGFAFNCLSSYSDKDRWRNYLYYADPCQIFDLCKNRYSSQVTLLHDYELFEFTILVRKKHG